MINQQNALPYNIEVSQPANTGYNIDYGFEQNNLKTDNNFPSFPKNENAQIRQNNYNDIDPSLDPYIRESIEPIVEDEQVKSPPSNINPTFDTSSTQAMNLIDLQPKNNVENNPIYYNNQQIDNIQTQIMPSVDAIPTQKIDNELLYNISSPTHPHIDNNILSPQVQTPIIENNININPVPQTQIFDNNSLLSLQNTIPKVEITNLAPVPNININNTINTIENESILYTPTNQAITLAPPPQTIAVEPNPMIVKVQKTVIVPQVKKIIVPTKKIILVNNNASYPLNINNVLPVSYPSATIRPYTPTLSHSPIVYNTSTQTPIMATVAPTPQLNYQQNIPTMIQRSYNINTLNPIMSGGVISNVGIGGPMIYISRGHYRSRSYNVRRL